MDKLDEILKELKETFIDARYLTNTEIDKLRFIELGHEEILILLDEVEKRKDPNYNPKYNIYTDK